MADLQQLPLHGGEIETRPAYVEDWLDSLPYIDFNQTINVLHAALKASNKIQMKAGQRMELVALYHRPYYYYLGTQIRTGAQHTIQSIDVMQSQVAGMRLVAVELARASRMAMEDALKHKSLWGQNKQPLLAILMSIKYLSHALIYNFLEYALPPQKAWQELNFLYQYALKIEQQNTPVKLIGKDQKKASSTIEHAYKRMLLVSLADPYHLPFGAIWEIYHQLEDWADLAVTGPYKDLKDPGGVFVITLDKDSGPVALSKFDREKAGQKHRLLITEKLQVTLAQILEKIEHNKGSLEHLKLSPYYAEYLLHIVHKAWGLPQKRIYPRKAKAGSMNIAHGINSIYYFLNNQQDFTENIPAQEDEGDAVITDVGFSPVTPTRASYRKETWNLVDTSSGGIAITREGKPKNIIRVGDLAGTALDEENYPIETFHVGIIRWLLVRQGKIFKMGIQLFNQRVYAAALAIVDNGSDTTSRRAILLGNPDKEKEIQVITNHGLYKPGREYGITFNGKNISCKPGGLLESTTCLDHFEITLEN